MPTVSLPASDTRPASLHSAPGSQRTSACSDNIGLLGQSDDDSHLSSTHVPEHPPRLHNTSTLMHDKNYPVGQNTDCTPSPTVHNGPRVYLRNGASRSHDLFQVPPPPQHATPTLAVGGRVAIVGHSSDPLVHSRMDGIVWSGTLDPQMWLILNRVRVYEVGCWVTNNTKRDFKNIFKNRVSL